MRRRSMKIHIIISAMFLVFLSGLLTGCNGHQKDHASAVQHRFNDIELWVKRFEDPERDKWQKPAEVVQSMNLRQGDVVADLGAGTGYFTRRFAVAVGPSGKAIGLDIEPGMVQHMMEDAAKLDLQNYEARVVRTDDPELVTASVDVVFLCNTYHHIENRVDYFKKVLQGLKTNGRVVIVDFYKDTDFGPPRDHKLSKDVVLKEMKSAGYGLKKSHDFLPEQYFLEFGI